MEKVKVKQKQEAIARMKLLKLHENVIREFEKEGIVNLSENGGFLYWLNGDQQAIVDDFEAEHGALVYHVIHKFGTEIVVYIFFFFACATGFTVVTVVLPFVFVF